MIGGAFLVGLGEGLGDTSTRLDDERVVVPAALLIVATTFTPSLRTTDTSAVTEPMIARIPVVESRPMPAVRTIRPSSDSQWSRDSIGRVWNGFRRGDERRRGVDMMVRS